MESICGIAVSLTPAMVVSCLVGIPIVALLVAKSLPLSKGQGAESDVDSFKCKQECERCVELEQELSHLRQALAIEKEQLEDLLSSKERVTSKKKTGCSGMTVFSTQTGKSWHQSRACASSRAKYAVNELQPCSFCVSKSE